MEAKENRFINKILETSDKIERLSVVRIIRNGLVQLIPILMIGAFALVLRDLPITGYVKFIKSFLNGLFYNLFDITVKGTFGLLSIYMALSFSISYFSTIESNKALNTCGLITSLVCFLIMDGIATEDFSISTLDAKSVFVAMISSLLSSFLYIRFNRLFSKKNGVLSKGVDKELNSTMQAIIPALFTILIAIMLNNIVYLTGFNTVNELTSHLFTSLFKKPKSNFFAGWGFVNLSSLLWCFGIHGSNCLETVNVNVLMPLLNDSTQVLSKQFIDCFVLMGGCGSSICLLISILLFSKNKGMKSIAKKSTLPIVFNISELLVFGIPVVFNPIMLIPFIAVPSIQYVIAYAATASGLVPIITAELAEGIPWTTPVLFGGYFYTGSIMGTLLQLFNIIVGVAIYTPFVKIMVKAWDNRENNKREDFIKWYKQNEANLVGTKLTEKHGIYGEIAKQITLDMETAIKEKKYRLFYQPQYNSENKCIGVEGLLRWPNIESLAIYPPILIQLAEESGILEELEKGVLELAVSERDKVFEQFGDDIKISINVTAMTIEKDSYWEHLKSLITEHPFEKGRLCIEITEKAMITLNERMIKNFKDCRKLGIMFAIDDFAVGQTSINYLKDGLFDIIKLDGSLVLGINTNVRCKEIISSIVRLSDSLNVTPLAEFVENEEIRNSLLEVGCKYYQGYYFSKPVPLKDIQ